MGAIEGKSIWFEIEEIGLEGWALVTSIRGPPTVEDGPGRVILSTLTHVNEDVYKITLAGSGEVLEPTPTHLFYSEDRDAWLPASQLVGGETLRTAHGTVPIAEIEHVPGARRVFNIEVEDTHHYFVSDADVLSHNACPKSPTPAIRRWVNEPRTYVDPETNRITQAAEGQVLQADHVFPQSKLKALDGFEDLTRKEQDFLLNHPDNFEALPESWNKSKKDLWAKEWKDIGMGTDARPEYIEQLQARQEAFEEFAKEMIARWKK